MPSPRMTEDEIWSFVTDSHTGIMTTLRRDGSPVSLPLWFVCLDRQIYCRTRGKKLDRIRHDSRASFLVESGLKWAELKAAHLSGIAEIVDLDADLAQRFNEETARKYASFRTTSEEMPSETAEHYRRSIGGVVRFTPTGKILNWDNAKLQ
ncbi:MAG: pyridoxamine 5'-phosphate oxidase family protein [Actinomycetota bacterium]|nr:pyridoxamine 5'-phosphate oxidase family protein [Actinomycetota bacterium]